MTLSKAAFESDDAVPDDLEVCFPVELGGHLFEIDSFLRLDEFLGQGYLVLVGEPIF